MVWIEWVVIIIFIATAILFYFMVKSFKNPVVKHSLPPGLPFKKVEEITFTTQNNKKVYGWWIPVDANLPTIIFIHGWGRNTQRMMSYIKKFCCMDVNLLAFDARGHGNSDPDGYANLYKFAQDIIAAMDYLTKQNKVKNDNFYLVGLSIGGAASIYAAGNDPRIKKVVTVGAFAHPKAVMEKQFKDKHIPYFPLVWMLYKYLIIFQSLDLEQIAPEKHIVNSKADFLLVHGKKDKTVPVEQAIRLKEVAGDNVELLLMENRGHSDCHLEPGFWDKLTEFFKVHPTKNQKV